jgi:putative tricarboxylic transport membrane protein
MPSIGQRAAQALFFILFGLAGIVLGRDMPVGTAGDMGVGYVPRALAIGCLAIGAILAVSALRARTVRQPLDLSARPALAVIGLVVAFAGLLPWLGLPLTILVVVLAAPIAGEPFRWATLALTALTLAAGSTLLFHTLLRLQVPVWPSLAWP